MTEIAMNPCSSINSTPSNIGVNKNGKDGITVGNLNALSVDQYTSIASSVPTIILPLLCQPNNTYATEHISDYSTSPNNRCVNKNANGPNIRVPRAPLTDLTTPTTSYSHECARVVQRTRNKNFGGPTPKVLNTSVTPLTYISPQNIDGVLNDTIRGEMKTSDHTVMRGVNKNMHPVIKCSNAPVNQTTCVSGVNYTCLLKANAEALSMSTSVQDAPVTVTIGKAPQDIYVEARPTIMDEATHSLNSFDLKNAIANLHIERDQVVSADATVNNIQVKTPIHISVEARPGHYYNSVVYDRPLYRR